MKKNSVFNMELLPNNIQEEDDNIIFRRYAIQWLREIFVETPSDVAKYRADWNEEQLAEGSDWWRQRYEQGLLVRQSL